MRVLLDHDGGVDDFVALALLAASAEVDLIGVVATPGDTYMERSVPTTRALLALAGLAHVEVAEGTIEGPNPFPDEFRIDGKKVWDRTMVHEVPEPWAPLAPEAGHEFTVRILGDEPEPVTMICTGPLTTLAAALDLDPGIQERISRLYWMGGALDVKGNVAVPGHDGSAEWNVYADPGAAARVFQSDLDIWMCPLDATNKVPLSEDLISRLEACPGSALAAFAAQSYRATDQTAYHLWDVLTSAWPVEPDLLFPELVPCAIQTEAPNTGQTRRVFAGREVTAALDVDAEHLLDVVVQRLCTGRDASRASS